jgi:hypothetical protein
MIDPAEFRTCKTKAGSVMIGCSVSEKLFVSFFFPAIPIGLESERQALISEIQVFGKVERCR